MFDMESMIQDAIRQAGREAGIGDLLRRKDPSQKEAIEKLEALGNAVWGGPRFDPSGLDEATRKKFMSAQRKAATTVHRLIEKTRARKSTDALQNVAMRAIRELKMTLAAATEKPEWIVPYVRGVERTMSALAA